MFDIQRFTAASDAADAVRLLREDPDAVLIAGGTDVLIRIREGKLPDAHLVSIHGLPELTGVRRTPDGTIVIGPATPFAVLAADPIIQTCLPFLGEAVSRVGGPQTREAGTVGGNLVNGATSADSAPSLCALNAQLVLRSADGTRTVPITAFYTGPGRTVRRRDELLTEIRILPEDYAGFAGETVKYGKRAAMEIATLGCAVLVRLSDDKRTVRALRLAYGVAAPTPIRCPQAEAAAAGKSVSAALADEIAHAVLDEVNPRSSWRASREFRLQLIEELTRRAFRAAVIRAGGAI